MIHEHIKAMAMRGRAIDKVVFGESPKAHPFGVGGMAMDLAEDNLLLQLNSAYDTDTDFALYTESVKKAVDRCIDSFASTQVNSLYKESKFKSVLSKIWEWFKKVGKYLKELPKRMWAYLSKKFGRKKEVAVAKTAEDIKNKRVSTFMIAYDEMAKIRIREKEDADKLVKRIEDGVSAGLASIKFAEGNNVRYTSADINKLVSKIVTSPAFNKSLEKICELPEFDKHVYSEVKGTEYELPFITSLATMVLIHSEVMPYMPARVEEYMVSLGAKPAYSFEKQIFTASTSVKHDGVSVNMGQLLNSITAHFESIMKITVDSTGGASLSNKEIMVIDGADVYIDAMRKYDDAKSFMNSNSLESFTNANFIGELTKLIAPINQALKLFTPVTENPKCILKKVSLSECIENREHYGKQAAFAGIIAMYEDFSDMFGETSKFRKAVEALMDGNRNLTEETATKAVNMIMNALSPLTGIASAVTKSLTLIFVSWSEVEEEMTGFFGTSADINNVPLTAMAKAIANNKHERAYLIDMLRLDK